MKFLLIVITLIFTSCGTSKDDDIGSQVGTFSNVNTTLQVFCFKGCHQSGGEAGSTYILKENFKSENYAAIKGYINLTDPEDSTLLLKATGSVSHEGGKLFTEASSEYSSILQWIRSGARDN